MKKILVGFAVIVAAGVYVLLRNGDEPVRVQQLETSAASAAGVAPVAPLPSDGVAYRERGSYHGVAPALFEAPTPPGQEVRVGLGDNTTLKFNQPPRAPSGMGMGRMKAVAFHGQDKPIELEVKKTEKGVEVPFSPPLPGQFNVVLSENDSPVGAQLVGVVGAVGAADLTDPEALFNADPMTFRARTPGRMTKR